MLPRDENCFFLLFQLNNEEKMTFSTLNDESMMKAASDCNVSLWSSLERSDPFQNTKWKFQLLPHPFVWWKCFEFLRNFHWFTRTFPLKHTFSSPTSISLRQFHFGLFFSSLWEFGLYWLSLKFHQNLPEGKYFLKKTFFAPKSVQKFVHPLPRHFCSHVPNTCHRNSKI